MARRGAAGGGATAGGVWAAGWRALQARWRQAGVQYRWRRTGVKAVAQAGQGVVPMSLRMSLHGGDTLWPSRVDGADRDGGAGGSGDRVASAGCGADTVAGVGIRCLRVMTRGRRGWPARQRMPGWQELWRVAWAWPGPWPWSGSAAGR